MSTLLPLFLKLGGRRVVVVGGGKVATTKIEQLLKAEADVTVIATMVKPEIRELAVHVEQRAFSDNDVEGAWLVIAAATPEANEQVARAAEAKRIWCNVVDDRDRASAYFASVLRRDHLTIAVSTEGEAPALAALVRSALELLLPDDVEVWLAEAKRLRAQWRSTPIEGRRPILLRALDSLYGERA